MKLRLTRSAVLISVLVLAGASVVIGAGPASANPAISVSPSTGLHAGQVVTVTGSGFTKNGSVFIVECQAGAASES